MPDTPSPKLVLDLLAHAHALTKAELGKADITVTLAGGAEFTGKVEIVEDTRDILVLGDSGIRHVLVLSQVVAVSIG